MESNNQSFLDFSTEYKTGKQFDTFVIAEDGFVFKAHELCLSKGSEFFKTFFEFSFHVKNKNTECISINLEFTKSILANVLHFLYSGNIRICKESVCDLTEAADFLLIDDLVKKCRDYMLKNISLDTCVSFLTTSYFLENLRIRERCFRFVCVNFNSILLKYNSDISELPFVVFRALIKENSLRVTDEYEVFIAIVSWVESDRSNRLKDVPELLSSIRWSELSSLAKSRIAEHNIFKENELCRHVKLEQLIKKQENEYKEVQGRFPPKIHIFSREKALKRKLSSTNSSVPRGRITEIYMTYDEEMDKCRKIAETTDQFDCLVAAGQFIFKFNVNKKLVTAYDLVKKEWSTKSPLRKKLGFAHFVQCEHFIFAVPLHQSLSKVKFYDLSTNEWIKCAPFPSVFVCGASVLSGRLCVVGRTLSGPTRMVTLVYDIASGVWSNIAAPKQDSFSCSLINFRERLFMLGGTAVSREREIEYTKRVEVYRPEVDEWFEFQPLPFLYQEPQAMIVKDKLIVYEERSVTHSRPPCITWNEKTEAWDVLNSSPYNTIEKYKFCFVNDENVLKTLSKENKDLKTVWDASMDWNAFEM